MNTREEIISLLSKSEKPLGPKIIALELKKNSVNIRKILSNLYKEGKITKAGYGEYISSVNVKNKSVNVLGESVNIGSLEANKLIKKARYEYMEKWRARNPNYSKEWLRKARKKDPKKFKEYQRRYWLKRAMLSD